MSNPQESDVERAIAEPATRDRATQTLLMKPTRETDPLLGDKAKAKVGWFGLSHWLGTLNTAFGYELLALLFYCQHLNKGMVNTMQGNAEPYIYKMYHVPAPQVQIFEGITSLPWAAKPIIGVLSDAFPIAGLNKAPYLLLFSCLGVLAFAILGFISFSSIHIVLVVLMITLMNLQQSACDTLSEAKYAAEIQIRPKYGPDMLTYVWFGVTAAGLVGTVLSGTMLQYWSPHIVFIFCLPFAATIFYSVWQGHMVESVQSVERVRQARQKLCDQWEVIVLCIVVFMCSLFLMVCGCVNPSPTFNAVVSLVVSVVMLVSFSVFLSPAVARLNVFLFLDSALSLDIGGAAFYFYTDTPAQYPDGPHFSPFFYNTVLGVIASVFSLVGIYCYNRFTYDWTYRNLMIAVNLVGSAFSVLDIIMFARLNLKWGISDHFMVVGSTIFDDIFGEWSWMPTVVVLSHFCPKGMEATAYALLAGSSNLGEVVAANFGSFMLQQLGCDPSGSIGEGAQFNNLWLAAVIATVLPLVEVVGLIWLLPNARQNESIELDSDRDITAHSLWKQLTT